MDEFKLVILSPIFGIEFYLIYSQQNYLISLGQLFIIDVDSYFFITLQMLFDLDFISYE